VPRERLGELLAGAAMLVLGSRSHEFSPFSVLEAMGAGVPAAVTRSGGVLELVGERGCVARNDPDALAARMAALWADPQARRAEGEALLARARERHSEERYLRELLGVYGRAGA
jgi:glycosyltransferase involved in cell wall biosynthesis